MTECEKAAEMEMGGGRPPWVLVDRWRGMNTEQLSAIQREREEQRLQRQVLESFWKTLQLPYEYTHRAPWAVMGEWSVGVSLCSNPLVSSTILQNSLKNVVLYLLIGNLLIAVTNEGKTNILCLSMELETQKSQRTLALSFFKLYCSEDGVIQEKKRMLIHVLKPTHQSVTFCALYGSVFIHLLPPNLFRFFL